MRLTALRIFNFRNIRECEIQPAPGLNFLHGMNAQGKTSFLEAISFLSTLRSFRGAQIDEVVGWTGRTSEISCSLASEEDPSLEAKLTVSYSLDPRGAKTVAINGKPIRSGLQFLSKRYGEFDLAFHSIAFNPSDHELIGGAPSGRRAYLNRAIAAENPAFLGTLQRYQRLINQRNAVLKTGSGVIGTLEAFDSPWIDLAVVIVHERLAWLGRLNSSLPARVKGISPTSGPLAVLYQSSSGVLESDGSGGKSAPHFPGQDPLPSLEGLKRVFSKRLESLRDLERRVGTTLLGPHRDDWRFHTLDAARRPLQGHGSQGEIRTVLLAMKLVEIDLFRERTGHRPVLLVDDFSSELDRERRGCLMRFLSASDLQVFVTSTEEAMGTGKSFCVRAGHAGEDRRGQALLSGL